VFFLECKIFALIVFTFKHSCNLGIFSEPFDRGVTKILKDMKQLESFEKFAINELRLESGLGGQSASNGEETYREGGTTEWCGYGIGYDSDCESFGDWYPHC